MVYCGDESVTNGNDTRYDSINLKSNENHDSGFYMNIFNFIFIEYMGKYFKYQWRHFTF